MLVEHHVHLGERKAGQLQIEIKVDQTLQLDRQELPIPARIKGELVVRNHVGAPFCFSEVRQPQRRNCGLSKEPDSLHAAVAGNDLVGVADQHRVVKPEPFYASGDLLDLLSGMSAGVAWIRVQLLNRKAFNVHGFHDFHLSNHRPGLAGNSVREYLSRFARSNDSDRIQVDADRLNTLYPSQQCSIRRAVTSML